MSRGVVLTVRFLCELAMLVALAYWGFHVFDGAAAFIAATGAPLAAIIVWAEFVAPRARHPVSVPVRLAIEDTLFVLTTAALAAAGRVGLAIAFAVAAFATSWLGAWTEGGVGTP